MNELEIIRSQLAMEQVHAAEIANAAAAVLGGSPQAAAAPDATALFREACVSYLVWVLARFEERDQTLSELLAARHSDGNGAAASSPHLGGLIARSGTSREALVRLESALAGGESQAAGAGWQEFARFFNSAWVPRRAALEAALPEHLSMEEWRAVAGLDADSILDERRRYARIVALLPAGIELRQPAAANRP